MNDLHPKYSRAPGLDVRGLSLRQQAVALTALRRIRSLDEKNVPKYAQEIASDALRQVGHLSEQEA